MTVGSASSTKVVMNNSENGWKTIITGSGFTFDPITGEPTGGIIDKIVSKDGSGAKTQVIELIPGLSVVDFYNAIIDANKGDWTALKALTGPYQFVVDATQATESIETEMSSNDDVFKGSSYGDTVSLSDGGDKAYGNDGNGYILGGKGKEYYAGDKGKDWLIGGGGKDVMVGGKGNDVLKGGAGADTFNFETGPGDDKIKDFVVGLDVIIDYGSDSIWAKNTLMVIFQSVTLTFL